MGNILVKSGLAMTGLAGLATTECGMNLPRKQTFTFAFSMFIIFTAMYKNKHYYYNVIVVT